MNEQIRVFAANHRTLWFGAISDLAKITIIIAALYWGLQ